MCIPSQTHSWTIQKQPWKKIWVKFQVTTVNFWNACFGGKFDGDLLIGSCAAQKPMKIHQKPQMSLSSSTGHDLVWGMVFCSLFLSANFWTCTLPEDHSSCWNGNFGLKFHSIFFSWLFLNSSRVYLTRNAHSHKVYPYTLCDMGVQSWSKSRSFWAQMMSKIASDFADKINFLMRDARKGK